MENLIKTFGRFIGIGLLNIILFTFYLSVSGLSGGDVGMLPYLLLVESGITVVLSTVLYLVFKNKFKVTTIGTILLYQIAYLLTLISTGINPIEDNHSGIAIWIYLISFLVTGLLIIILKNKHK